jgi:hypothetical protein
MASDKTISQRRFDVRLDFDFGEQKLGYRQSDQSGSREFSVPYQSIMVREPGHLTVNQNRFSRLLLVVPLILWGMGGALHHHSNDFGATVMWLGFGCFLILFAAQSFKLFAIKYTLLQMAPSPSGANGRPLLIIKDKQHDRIFEEIKDRWRECLRSLHLRVNPANAPDKEAAKFAWLKANGVIDDEEYRVAIAELEGATELRTQPTVKTLN